MCRAASVELISVSIHFYVKYNYPHVKPARSGPTPPELHHRKVRGRDAVNGTTLSSFLECRSVLPAACSLLQRQDAAATFAAIRRILWQQRFVVGLIHRPTGAERVQLKPLRVERMCWQWPFCAFLTV